jgi:dihydroflavonol-4-reductase
MNFFRITKNVIFGVIIAILVKIRVNLKSIMGILEQVSGVPTPKVSITYPLALGMAWTLEQFSRVTGKPPLITRQAVQTLQHDVIPSTQKARRELGF